MAKVDASKKAKMSFAYLGSDVRYLSILITYPDIVSHKRTFI